MAVNQATAADVSMRALRDLTVLEAAWVTVRLGDAFTQIIAVYPQVAARLDAGMVTDPFNQLVIQVQAAMVLRVLGNPDGVLEETGDDYTRRLDASVSTGALYVTDREAEMLTAYDTTGSAVFSIRPSVASTWAGAWATPDTFVPGGLP